MQRDELLSKYFGSFKEILLSDARLQYTLAKETVKDSKAKKTVATIMIVFLPGTFVAAIFSTDLAPTKERQGPIFAAVVVPVTVVLIVA
ncbi:hypothetical protein O1611_g7962 [Lasiodiplodia mahajangana]|uniref:Uncharacterized protein n=1 Tax=Lasiodiplodia mahajangana TaxID=1108764 RepID=A0ACC2JDS8_9PEZI|nr:hypothetical protein O1611_g7962 [Lasiodiplodia mahajangana]